MKLKIGLFVLLITTLICEGNLSLLDGILSTAQIHSKVQDVAGTILHGINKGFNFNFGGHAGVNEQIPPGYGYGPPQRPQHEYGPNNNPYEQNYGQGPHGHNGYNPNQNGFQQPINNNQNPYPTDNGYNRPIQNENQNFHQHHENENQRFPNNHNHHQQYPNNGNYDYHNQAHPNNENYDNYNNNYPINQNQGYSDNHNYPNNNGNNNQNNVNEPNFGNEPVNENHPNNGYDSTQGQTYPHIISTPSQRPEVFTSTSLYTTEINKSNEDGKATQKPAEDDFPLFIPLSPNDYVYAGDKINVTDPKRHTDKKPQPVEEEDFAIDIRFKDG